eukprot:scpid54841/ scgid28008/ 
MSALLGHRYMTACLTTTWLLPCACFHVAPTRLQQAAGHLPSTPLGNVGAPPVQRTVAESIQLSRNNMLQRINNSLAFLFPDKVTNHSLSANYLAMAHTPEREEFLFQVLRSVLNYPENPRYLREGSILLHWMEMNLTDAMVGEMNENADRLICSMESAQEVLTPDSAFRTMLYVASLLASVSQLDVVLRTELVATCSKCIVQLLKERTQPLVFWEVLRLSRMIVTGRLYDEALLSSFSSACQHTVTQVPRYYNLEFAHAWFYPLVFMSYPAEQAMVNLQNCSESLGSKLPPIDLIRLSWSYLACNLLPPEHGIDALQRQCPIALTSPNITCFVRPLQPFLLPDSLDIPHSEPYDSVWPAVFKHLRSLFPAGRCRVACPYGDWVDLAAVYCKESGEFVPLMWPQSYMPRFTLSEAQALAGQPVALLIVPPSHMLRDTSSVSGVYGYQKRQLLLAGWRVITLDQRQVRGLDFRRAAEFILHYFCSHCHH